MVIVFGGAGIEVATLDNFNDAFAEFPQTEVNKTLTLSPNIAELLRVYLTTIVCEFTSPESITALAPSEPVKDHNQPVAANADPETPGRDGAEYRYTFPEQILVTNGVTTILDGEAGAEVSVFVNFTAALMLFPQAEV